MKKTLLALALVAGFSASASAQAPLENIYRLKPVEAHKCVAAFELYRQAAEIPKHTPDYDLITKAQDVMLNIRPVGYWNWELIRNFMGQYGIHARAWQANIKLCLNDARPILDLLLEKDKEK